MIQSIIDHHYINRLCDCSCHQKENLNRHLFMKERSHLNVTFVTKLLSQFMMEISPWYVWLVRKYLQQRNLEFARKDKTYYIQTISQEYTRNAWIEIKGLDKESVNIGERLCECLQLQPLSIHNWRNSLNLSTVLTNSL